MEQLAFELSDTPRRAALARLVMALAAAKRTGDFADEAYWEGFLDAEARAAFWWPTDEEHEAYIASWYAVPPEARAGHPDLERPWVFEALIAAVEASDLEDLAWEATPTGGVLRYRSRAEPRGGAEWMRVLVAAFGGSPA